MEATGIRGCVLVAQGDERSLMVFELLRLIWILGLWFTRIGFYHELHFSFHIFVALSRLRRIISWTQRVWHDLHETWLDQMQVPQRGILGVFQKVRVVLGILETRSSWRSCFFVLLALTSDHKMVKYWHNRLLSPLSWSHFRGIHSSLEKLCSLVIQLIEIALELHHPYHSLRIGIPKLACARWLNATESALAWKKLRGGGVGARMVFFERGDVLL